MKSCRYFNIFFPKFHGILICNVHTYESLFAVVGGTSSDQTQQAAAANIMSGSMKLLSLMGMGSQPSASNATEHSGLFILMYSLVKLVL